MVVAPRRSLLRALAAAKDYGRERQAVFAVLRWALKEHEQLISRHLLVAPRCAQENSANEKKNSRNASGTVTREGTSLLHLENPG